MKKILLFIYLFFCSYVHAQTNDTKRDNIWLFGYSDPIGANGQIDSSYDNSIINFAVKPIKAKRQTMDMNFNDDIAIISDTTGKLLFYTNGIYIADATHQPMLNGKGLNPGKTADKNEKYGYILPQGSLILPKPGNPDLYYLIHISTIFDVTNTPNDYKGEKLYYTLIDMSKNNGKGEVIEKNKVIIGNKFVDYGKITACRHANGKDWWIIVADFDTKSYNILSLSEKGIKLEKVQKFKTGNWGSVGQAVFSPDGTKYARFSGFDLLENNLLCLFDFDRCAGTLSNQKTLLTQKMTFAVAAAFSPNSQFLYIFDHLTGYQFDTKELKLKPDTVAIYDNFEDTITGINTVFYQAQLAPDNKIYLSTIGSTKYLHVIHEPNKKGKACNVEQHGFNLAGINYTTMPNFPNFRLGKAAQPCTVGVEDEESDKNIKIYPNPVHDILTIEATEILDNQTVSILDMLGKTVLSQKLSLGKNNINMSDFPNGTYILKVGNATRKLVKM